LGRWQESSHKTDTFAKRKRKRAKKCVNLPKIKELPFTNPEKNTASFETFFFCVDSKIFEAERETSHLRQERLISLQLRKQQKQDKNNPDPLTANLQVNCAQSVAYLRWIETLRGATHIAALFITSRNTVKGRSFFFFLKNTDLTPKSAL